MEDVDLGAPTSFLDHENLGCTQRECTISSEIVTKQRDMFEAKISAGSTEKLPTEASKKTDAETISLLVLSHGKSREEMCGKLLRTCKQNYSTIN